MYPTGYEGSKIQNVVSFGRHPRRPGGIDSGKTSRFSDEVCNRISPQPTAHSPTPTPTVSLAANSCRRPPLHLSLAADVRRARTHVCCAVECRVSICLKTWGTVVSPLPETVDAPCWRSIPRGWRQCSLWVGPDKAWHGVVARPGKDPARLVLLLGGAEAQPRPYDGALPDRHPNCLR